MILPGATIGVLGSGQLGRMFAIAARRMGYRVHTFSPETDTPTGQVADKEWTASYNDLGAIHAFTRGVDVITFEFENIPVETINEAAQLDPVFPSGRVLHTTQHRLREKTFLSQAGFPVVPFAPIKSEKELEEAIKRIGTPAVLKSAGFGYDGKGQKKINSASEVSAAFAAVGKTESVLEGFISFEKELSVIAARGQDKSIVTYDVFENEHVNHILDITTSPAKVSDVIKKEAIQIAQGILEALDVVGVMCVEMFLTKQGKLLVNELAPRPHNSGHLTFDACVTSQFEQQVRAVCGLPLGSPELLRPAAMVNLLGDVWSNGEPNWSAALKDTNLKLHLYGKAEPRAGRKMGHLTALANSVEDARRLVIQARDRLTRR